MICHELDGKKERKGRKRKNETILAVCCWIQASHELACDPPHYTPPQSLKINSIHTTVL